MLILKLWDLDKGYSTVQLKNNQDWNSCASQATNKLYISQYSVIIYSKPYIFISLIVILIEVYNI